MFAIFYPKTENTSLGWLREANYSLLHFQMSTELQYKTLFEVQPTQVILEEEMVVVKMLLLATIGHSGIKLFTWSFLIG